MISAILFDMDGTIIDTELLAFKAILDCSQKWGLSIDRKDAAVVAGKKWEVAFELLYKKYEFPLSTADSSEAILSRYRELMNSELKVVSGVIDSIQDFSSKGMKLGLVSGSHRREILWTLDKLDIKEHFTVILGAEDYPNSKPAPDGFQKALELLSLKPEDALVFEDSHAGIASAKAVGCKVCAIFSTNHFQHDLSLADEQIRDFQGVTADWVQATFKK